MLFDIISFYIGVQQQHAEEMKDVDIYLETEKHIIWSVQSEAFGEEIRCIRDTRALNKKNSLVKLNPDLDHDGIVRVEGWLTKAELKVTERSPVIIPGKQHIHVVHCWCALTISLVNIKDAILGLLDIG